jgi:hypothetical protein
MEANIENLSMKDFIVLLLKNRVGLKKFGNSVVALGSGTPPEFRNVVKGAAQRIATADFGAFNNDRKKLKDLGEEFVVKRVPQVQESISFLDTLIIGLSDYYPKEYADAQDVEMKGGRRKTKKSKKSRRKTLRRRR